VTGESTLLTRLSRARTRWQYYCC